MPNFFMPFKSVCIVSELVLAADTSVVVQDRVWVAVIGCANRFSID